MLACLITNQAPRSIQSRNLPQYKKYLINEFHHHGYSSSEKPFSFSLYSKVIYIHRSRKAPVDVDNMSKPLVDAFNGIIYSDDNIINHRVCSKISRHDINAYELNLTVLPDAVAEKFDEYLENDSEHILYYEVGTFSESMVFAGAENSAPYIGGEQDEA